MGRTRQHVIIVIYNYYVYINIVVLFALLAINITNIAILLASVIGVYESIALGTRH